MAVLHIIDALRGPSAEAVAQALSAKLIELAWYDGLRTGLAAGVIGGAAVGALLAALIKR